MDTVKIVRTTPEMKLVAEGSLKMRDIQSIHDCCLAGKYLVIFEYPITFYKKWIMLGYTYFQSTEYTPERFGTLIHIFDKEDLKHVTTIETKPLYNYHFSNGYCPKDGEIVLQYCRYDEKSMPGLIKYLADFPKLALDKKIQIKESILANFEEMTIDVPNKKITSIDRDARYAVEFPVVSDRLVGKDWSITYAAMM
jgi:carotenoid cleavage dioxygenase-like enzyme